MLYALVGVPLMLMCLSSLGGFLAEALQCSYGRLCGAGAETSNGGGRGRQRDGTGEIHVNNCQLAENEVSAAHLRQVHFTLAEVYLFGIILLIRAHDNMFFLYTTSNIYLHIERINKNK